MVDGNLVLSSEDTLTFWGEARDGAETHLPMAVIEHDSDTQLLLPQVRQKHHVWHVNGRTKQCHVGD